MSILRKIKRLLGHRVYIEPIVDANIYPNLDKSYAGGSLAESNVLIVTNISIPNEQLIELAENENATFSTINTNGLLSSDEIRKSCGKLIGPFTHIINIFKKDKALPLLMPNGGYPETDDMHRVYQWLQEEVGYLVPLDLGGSICTVYISDDSQYGKVLKKNMEMFALSLGDAISSHSIINNGIVAPNHVPLREILQAAMFMSSKYGQILGGTIHLKA